MSWTTGKKSCEPRKLKKLVELEIPGLPPTLNHLYRNNPKTGTRYKTASGRKWQEDVAALLARVKHNLEPYRGYAKFEVLMYSANYLRWDVDNRVKALQDTLSMSGVLDDDKQVIDLHARRLFGNCEKTVITVSVIDPDLVENPPVKTKRSRKTNENTVAKR